MISIIMPAFNEEKYISEAISSILKQSYQNFELRIIDDGSTDNTGNIIKEFAKNNSKKITYFHPGKIGKTNAFNLATIEAQGSWFYFMGADDIMPSNGLKNFMKYATQKNPFKKIAIRGRIRIISDNKKYNGLILPKNKSVLNWSGPYTFMSKAMVEEFIPIPSNYPNEDSWWSLFIKHFADERVAIDDIVVHYRIHDNNSISRKNGFADFNEKYHIRQEITKDFLESNFNRLSEKERLLLTERIKLESYRYNGEFWKILVSNKCSQKNKIRALFLLNPVTYSLKLKLDRYLLGL